MILVLPFREGTITNSLGGDLSLANMLGNLMKYPLEVSLGSLGVGVLAFGFSIFVAYKMYANKDI